MPNRLQLSFLLVIGFLCAGAAAQIQDPAQPEKSLGEIAREYRAQKAAREAKAAASKPVAAPASSEAAKPPVARPVPSPSPTTSTSAAPSPIAPAAPRSVVTAKPAVPTPARDEVSELTQTVAMQMWHKDYAGIDKLADSLRTSQARFHGGGWKLYTLYAQLETLNAGSNASDADWQERIQFFKEWMRARPQSITARVALANAYLAWAWEARGEGSADQVTDGGWKLFHQRNEAATNVLVEAAKLPTKDPQWNLVSQMIGRAEGADKTQLKVLLEKATAFEPDFYYVYQEYAQELLPKWAGQPGDLQAFADATYKRVGGQKGAFLYFQIASSLCGECGEFNPQSFSWPKLQEGFAAMETLYGVSPIKLNQFASLAAAYDDKAVAAKIFARIGDNWDPLVWGTRAHFDAQREWASAAAPAVVQPVVSAELRAKLDATQESAYQAARENRWEDAYKLLHQLIDTAKPLPGSEAWISNAYYMLAANEARLGHTQRAQALADEEGKLIADKAGAESLAMATAFDGMAMVETMCNQDERAIVDLRRALAIREATPQAAGPQHDFEMRQLATLYSKNGRNEDALAVLQSLVDATPKDSWQGTSLIGPLQQMASIYQQMGRYNEAEAALVRSLNILESVLPSNSNGLKEPLTRLASLYHAAGRTADEARMEARIKGLQDDSATRASRW